MTISEMLISLLISFLIAAPLILVVWLMTGAPRRAPKVAGVAAMNIKTARGTVFQIYFETEHYLICNQPESKDTMKEAMLDIEWFYAHGYRICTMRYWSAKIIFEKVPGCAAFRSASSDLYGMPGSDLVGGVTRTLTDRI